MRITRLILSQKIWEKINTKHHVEEHELEEAFSDPKKKYRFVESGHIQDEDLYSMLGRSDAGRLLIVYFILKPGSRAFIVSARDATSKERKLYEKK